MYQTHHVKSSVEGVQHVPKGLPNKLIRHCQEMARGSIDETWAKIMYGCKIKNQLKNGRHKQMN